MITSQIDGISGEPVGQILRIDETENDAIVKLDDSQAQVKVSLDCLENLPRRFAGTLCKYSTKGIIFKNWRVRYFEIWSNSLTYREEGCSKYKGHLPITPTTEIVTSTGKPIPPLPHAFGILNDGKIFRLCSENEQLVEEMKRSIQDCINDAVIYQHTWVLGKYKMREKFYW